MISRSAPVVSCRPPLRLAICGAGGREGGREGREGSGRACEVPKACGVRGAGGVGGPGSELQGM